MGEFLIARLSAAVRNAAPIDISGLAAPEKNK
jgi:hypothetical protein